MRTKTRNILDIRPGMVIRCEFSTRSELRQVAAVKHGPWAYSRQITFTDGTSQTYSRLFDFHVVRGKAARNAVRIRAAGLPRPTALESVFALLGGYGHALLTAGAR
jgi:hypothetical protein